MKHKLNLSEEYKDDRFWQFLDLVVSRLKLIYGANVQCFEHGPNSAGSRTGCGTDHAHLHAVPLDFDLDSEVDIYDQSLSWNECNATQVKELTGTKEYLFQVSRFDGIYTRGRLAILDQGRSQFFRRVISKKLGVESQYDYKTHPMMEVVGGTAALLHAANFEVTELKAHMDCLGASELR